jgi:ankyrin repeat protein
VLDLLASARADLTATDSKSRNILHYAAKFGHTHVLQWITAKRLDLPMTDHEQFTPLHFAAESGDQAMITQLLSMGVVQIRSTTGWTPILFAAKKNDLQSFRILLSHKGDILITNDVF